MLVVKLRRGLKELGLDLAPAVQDGLIEYVHVLEKWNRTYNLTAVRDPEDMVTRHLLDSLAIAPYVRGRRVADLGTGAGLPGIPLALALPDRQFTLIDSNAKKLRFVRHAAGLLGLANVAAVQTRIEQYRPEIKFDTLVCRAFAGISDVLAASRHLCAEDGEFLIMKGAYPHAELAALPAGFVVLRVAPLHVPGLDAARHLVILAQRTAAPTEAK